MEVKGDSLGLIEGERQERTGKQVYSGEQFYKDICRVRANCFCMSPTSGKMSEEAGSWLAPLLSPLSVIRSPDFCTLGWQLALPAKQQHLFLAITLLSDASSSVWG